MIAFWVNHADRVVLHQSFTCQNPHRHVIVTGHMYYVACFRNGKVIGVVNFMFRCTHIYIPHIHL